MEKELSAGSAIEARCTKCRAITNHIVIAMVGDTPAQVQCNTCQGRHNYRPIKAAASAKAEKAGKTTSRTPATRRLSLEQQQQQQWQDLNLAAKREQAKPYQLTTTFAVNAVISHPTFGIGIVTRKAGTNKIEVLFEQGCKLLRCG
ncbi:MAG: hypothetical protein C0620_00980 [Desulfuromonas sp.]|nr:MAG: hypothetical protein C0620_00980 [Desulfuromonas sp.]